MSAYFSQVFRLLTDVAQLSIQQMLPITGIVLQYIYFYINWPRGYKKKFMLNSAEHEILNAHLYKKF